MDNYKAFVRERGLGNTAASPGTGLQRGLDADKKKKKEEPHVDRWHIQLQEIQGLA